MLFQFGDTGFGSFHALAFEHERLGDNGHAENAEFASDFSNDRCSTRARTAPHTGSDEHHVCTTQRFFNVFALLFGSRTTCGRLGARTQTRTTQLHTMTRQAVIQRLRICVGCDKFNTVHVLTNHVVDGIATCTTHTDHFDDRAVGFFLDNFKHNCLR